MATVLVAPVLPGDYPKCCIRTGNGPIRKGIVSMLFYIIHIIAVLSVRSKPLLIGQKPRQSVASIIQLCQYVFV